MRTYLSLLLLLLFVGSGRTSAQQPFETFFRDSTLRLDYILTGGESTTEITPDEAIYSRAGLAVVTTSIASSSEGMLSSTCMTKRRAS